MPTKKKDSAKGAKKSAVDPAGKKPSDDPTTAASTPAAETPAAKEAKGAKKGKGKKK